MFFLFVFHVAQTAICKRGQDNSLCTLPPSIFVNTYDDNSDDCSGETLRSPDIWVEEMWNLCESRQNEQIGRILRCTGDPEKIIIEEYSSTYCEGSPSSSTEITRGECNAYRQPDGTLVKRKLSWTYSESDIVCPAGDLVVGVVKYSELDTTCTGDRSGDWIEMIPEADGTCFNTTTPRGITGTNIQRSVTCDSDSSAVILEYLADEENNPFLNCSSTASTFEITSGSCVQWRDPTDNLYSEYRRVYFSECEGRNSAAFLAVFWIFATAFLQN